ncbi:putative homogentisate 1,2-dioxygenase [Halenospora varia]|nr:putative homogentisate 1,2-dioxygenase [Halenospora varia]
MVLRLPHRSASAVSTFSTAPTAKDPYTYSVGFGNIFASEAVPGALPESGRNVPQKCPFDLYSEHLSGTSFVSSRATVQNVWMYRIRPAVAHSPYETCEGNPYLEACFSPQNSKVKFTPITHVWGPLTMPLDSEKGDPTQREGVAVHMYAANTSMTNEAFCNHDGDFMIVPQQGRLDIQTELGRMMVRPGEICVIQAGLRWKVSLPDGPVHGYINEVFGSHFELPDLGPIGANGLAHPRDFETPLASFDLDQSPWTIANKLTGELYQYKQNHTPFDVVAWHGNYAPYKYALEKFVALACVVKEQCDPTIYCVLTAKSKVEGVSLMEFSVFSPKWATATNTFRPPYYHRTMATEILGMIYGEYHGSVREMAPGHLSCENSYMPHGESYKSWRVATTKKLEPEFVGEGFMVHVSSHFSLTSFARNTHVNLEAKRNPAFWDDVQGHFLDHIEQINQKLASAGLSVLEVEHDRKEAVEVNGVVPKTVE